MNEGIEGKAHEIKGKMTGDRSEELKGKAEQAADKLKRAGRDIRDDISEKSDENREEKDAEERDREAGTVREQRPW